MVARRGDDRHAEKAEYDAAVTLLTDLQALAERDDQTWA